MLDLLNDLPELVYIVDPDTFDLLYINETGRKSFHYEKDSGKKCYEVFQNLDRPCPFCTTGILREDETYTWEYFNPVTQRHYLLKDRLSTINGRRVRSEVAFDVTEQAAEQQALRNALESEQMVLECVRQLHRQVDPARGIEEMLAVLGRSLQAHRTYIFQVQDGRLNNTFEWCADHVQAQKDNLCDMDPEGISRWMGCFHRGECVIINDLEDLRQSLPGEYAVLAPQNIKTLVAAPLEMDGEIHGFLGVDNPSADRIRNIVSLLQTLRYFLAATIRRMEDAQMLKQLSYCDTLTGLHNRNRFMEDFEDLHRWDGPVGMVYMDLNGLKAINDQRGHDQGDAALVVCARLLQAAFPTARCYRIGGDEFVAVETTSDARSFAACVARLREAIAADGRYQTAIGDSWVLGPVDPQQLMRMADAKMYDDKRRFYRDGGKNRRNRTDCVVSDFQQDNPLLREYNMLMSVLHVSVSKHLLRDDFKLLWANDYFYDLTGYTREEFADAFGDDISRYFIGEEASYTALQKAVFDAYHSGRASYEARLRIRRKDQRYIWINLAGIYTDEQAEGVPVVYTVFTDVTDLVQTHREQAVTFDSLPGFVFKVRIRHDGSLKLIYGNEQFTELFGQDDSGVTDLMRRNITRNAEAIARQMPKLLRGEPVSFETEAENVYGGVTHYQACGGCVEWEHSEPIFLFVCIDISEIIDQKNQMMELAYVDPVTGGRNRSRFERDAGSLLALSAPGTYSLASLDIQKFKVINDLFGIEAGDQTLRYIYTKIQNRLEDDELVCRLSADTFIILLRTDEFDAMEKRMQTIAEDINIFNRSLKHKYLLQMSVGIYPIDNTELSMTQLQDRANMARKQIKTTGSLGLCTCQLYNHGDRMRLAQEKDVENRMADALRDGQFVVYYQPKQCLQTGKIAGAEALVRWQDPNRGLVPPNDFIPLFETNGFIVQLDLYVFEQVCAMLRRWLDQGNTPMIISVNMSKAHLYDESFLRHYERIRTKYNVPAHLLELEVTESLIFENPQLLSRVIDDIHRCGYTCSMDDFGSGYSSLNVLRQVRVDTLKLDRAFFSSDSITDERESAVITTVVELAKRLKLTTVAEGVETEGQADFLRQAGCDLYQGFLFSRPVPMAEFERIAFGS